MASKVRYKIDLVSVFNSAFSDRTKEFRSKAKAAISNSDVKSKVSYRVIDEIISRTKDENIDKNGKAFTKYSDRYKKSHAFKVYAKSSNVTMTLTGEMLSSMVPVIKNSGYDIILEFADKLNNDKAHGHINGSKTLPVRNFFGLPKDKEQEIVREEVISYLRNSALSEFDV